jgi:ATP-binding cassette, subfamily B, bacterial
MMHVHRDRDRKVKTTVGTWCHGGVNGAHREERQLLRQIVGQFSPHRLKVALVCLLILVTSGLGIVNPLLIKVIFDHALFSPRGPNLGLLGLLTGTMIAITVVGGGLNIWRAYLTNSVGQQVISELRSQLYLRLHALSLRFFTATRAGEIQSRLTNDVGGLQKIVTESVFTIISSAVILISTIAAMTILSWQMTLFSLAILPLFGWQATVAGRVRRRVSSKTQAALADMNATIEETLSVSGTLLVKIFGRQAYEISRYTAQNERLTRLQVRQQMVTQGFSIVVVTFFSLMPVMVYLAVGFTGKISPGTVVAFTSLQFQLFTPLAQLLSTAIEIFSSLALFERIYGYLALTPDIIDSPTARPLSPPVRGAVRLDDVWFTYDGAGSAVSDGSPASGRPVAGRRWALSGVSLNIAPGMVAALVGPSGAGKSTISYLIPRLYETTHGTVRIDGIDVRQITQASLMDTIGMVTQDCYLFHASIRANLAYGRPDARDSDIEAAARAANIHNRILEFDDGYDTVVGERGHRLSGGERQRIAIARTILKNPRVLILDEATSALDTVNERQVQAALATLMAGRTTIAIAHRLSTIRAADIIYVLDSGRIAEEGTHSELLAYGGMYARLHEEQFGVGVGVGDSTSQGE